MNTWGKLYLIPNVLGEHEAGLAFPPYNREVVSKLTHFAVEQLKPARRLIRMLDKEKVIDDCTFYSLECNNSNEVYSQIVTVIKHGASVGVISDAGCPGVADPGAALVNQCQENEIEVIPLVGPSSILLALMASGLNGQYFCFHGYLPKDESARKQQLEKLIKSELKNGSAHIFIETPYRNDHLLQSMLQVLPESVKICIAADILMSNQYIKTRTVKAWKQNIPALKGRQVIFICGMLV
ncbi:MAG: SAM-dependent methyltransferase [Flavobacteriales bacterium]|nr:SAM-dependent methyltransferase [Flavobacteriales bacterium]